MKKVTILTTAHNGEAFIRQTIKSVLNQSEPDFWYFIRNNGSSDRTGEIIREYAKKDSRIVLLENKVNYLTDDGLNPCQRGWWPDFDSEYVAVLDHDDLLHKDFIKILYYEAKNFDADLAIAGNNFFEDKNPKVLIGSRIPQAYKIDDIKKLKPYFVSSYGPFRTQWGKLYKADWYSKYYEDLRTFPPDLKLCQDTYFIFNALKYCSRIVSVDKALLNYRIGSNSQFNAQILNPDRIHDGVVLFNKARDFLNENNILSQENYNFIHSVYLGHFLDLLRLLEKSNAMTPSQKLSYIQLILKETLLQKIRDAGIPSLESDIFNCVKSLLNKDLHEEYLMYYVYRLYHLIGHGVFDADYFVIALGILLDKENLLSYGEEKIFEQKWNALPLRESYLFKISHKDRLILLSSPERMMDFIYRMFPADEWEQDLEQKIIVALESEDYQQAQQFLTLLSTRTKISETALFCQIILLLNQGNFKAAEIYAHTAQILWPQSQAILNICEQLFRT